MYFAKYILHYIIRLFPMYKDVVQKKLYASNH